MSQTITLHNTVDAWTSPTRIQSMFSDTRLVVHSEARAFVYFTRPKLPFGSVINSAKLVVNPGPSAGSAAVTVDLHHLTSKFEPNSLTWAGQPTIGDLVASINRASWYMDGAPMEFDVAAEVQAYVDGGEWFGWRLSTASTDKTQYINSGNSTDPMSLIIEYTTPPARPIDLYPHSNMKVNDPKPTLSWLTPGGISSAQMAFQIQIATDEAFANIVHTTAEIPGGAHSYDLDSSAGFTELTDSQSRWWRVRVKGDSGTWSPYSLGAQFTYYDPWLLTGTGPAALTSDPTPNITWTYDGNMVAWEIVVTSLKDNRKLIDYDSGIQYGEAFSHTLPEGVVKYTGVQYTARLRVWDDASPASLSGANGATYREINRSWFWTPTGATPPIEGDLIPYSGFPYTHHRFLRWRYTGPTARAFLIQVIRNGRWIGQNMIDAAAARDGATEWYGIATWPKGRSDMVYVIQTVMPDGAMSPVEESLHLEERVDYKMPWVSSVNDANYHFCLVNASIDPGLSEISDVVVPLSGPSYLVQYSLQKFHGSATGEISSDAAPGSLTAEKMKDNLMWMRDNNPLVRFTFQDVNIQCYIYNVAYVPVGNSNGKTDYVVSFNFVEA